MGVILPSVWRSIIRGVGAAVVCIALVGQSLAQPKELVAVGETVRAAQEDGVRALKAEISRLPLGGGWTVGRFVGEFDANNDLMSELRVANQIGAPRWVENTCQVQLRIARVRVVRALQRIAAANRAPVTAVQIERAAQRWPEDAFDVTGTSALPEALKFVRPVAGDPWLGVAAEQRQKALDRAAEEASASAMKSVSGVRLAGGRTLGDAFADPQIAKSVKAWLASRPVTRVDFRDDLEVEVVLAADREDFFAAVREALEGQKSLPLPQDAAQWQEVERDFVQAARTAVGRARVGAAPDQKIERGGMFQWPANAPEWATQELEVVGRGEPRGTKLKTMAAADADAAAVLRRRIAELPLGQGMTVGKLAERDRAVADSVDRFVSLVRFYQTTPNLDGSMTVALRVDLRDLWEELQR
jgi:hypothetical protein